MAISDTDYISLLVKKVIYGVTETGGWNDSTRKSPGAETIPSPLIIPANTIWAETNALPSNPMTVGYIPYIMMRYQGLTDGTATEDRKRITMIKDPSISDGSTWIATTDGTVGGRLTNWIPFSFGSNYAVKAYNQSNTLMAADDPAYPYVFDYSAGVMQFPNASPGATTIYLEGYRYIGQVGVAANMVIPNMSTLNVIAGKQGDIAFVTDAGNGEFGMYMYTNPTAGTGTSNWTLFGTNDSATVDARTYTLTIDASSPPVSPVNIGNISGGRKITSVMVQVTTPFNAAATISVGDASVADRFMKVGENDLTDNTADGFITNPSYVYSGSNRSVNNTSDSNILVTYAENSATTGVAIISVSYQ